MKKATERKKNAPKKQSAHAKRGTPTKTAAQNSTTKAAPVTSQPQSKLQAATQAGVFLHTDDAWSLAYFNQNDLHCEERELFG